MSACNGRQDVAVTMVQKILMDVVTHLEHLKETNVNNVYPNVKIDFLVGAVKETVTYFNSVSLVCDTECVQRVRDIRATLMIILKPGGQQGPPNPHADKLFELSKLMVEAILTCPKGSFEHEAESSAQNTTVIAAHLRDTDDHIQNLKLKMNELETDYAEHAQALEDEKARLSEQAEANSKAVRQSNDTVLMLQNEVDKYRSAELQGRGVTSELVSTLQRKIHAYEQNVQRLMKEQLVSDKRTQALEEHLAEMKAQKTALDKKYREAIGQMEDFKSFQNAVNHDDLVSQIYSEMKAKDEQIDSMSQRLVEYDELYNEAMERIRRLGTNQSSVSVAKQLDDTATRLRSAIEELNATKSENAELRATMAQLEHSASQRIAQELQVYKSQHLESQDRAIREREISAAKERELLKLRHQHDRVKQDHLMQMRQLKEEHALAHQELQQARIRLQNQETSLKQRIEQMDRTYNAKISAKEYDIQRLREKLNNDYNRKVQTLTERFDIVKAQMMNEREQLMTINESMKREQVELSRWKQQLTKKSQEFQKRTSEFTAMRLKMESQLKNAEDQLRFYKNKEDALHGRLNSMNQALTNQRNTTEQQLTLMRRKVNQLEKEKLKLLSELTKHKASQMAAAKQVERLERANMELKEALERLNAEKTMLTNQYEAHLVKLRADNSKMSDDLQACSKHIQEASNVHEHVKRMTHQNQILQRQTEEAAAHARDQAGAFKRLLAQHTLDKQEKQELQLALQRAKGSEEKLREKMNILQTQIHELKQMNNSITQEQRQTIAMMNEMSARKESDRRRERLRHEQKEQMLRQKVVNKQENLSHTRNMLDRQRRNNDQMREALLLNELDQARIMEAVLNK